MRVNLEVHLWRAFKVSSSFCRCPFSTKSFLLFFSASVKLPASGGASSSSGGGGGIQIDATSIQAVEFVASAYEDQWQQLLQEDEQLVCTFTFVEP
jgi:hypothetical protein